MRGRGQRVEKRGVGIVRCRRSGCGDGFSGGRRATAFAIFFGLGLPNSTSRLTLCPEAIMRASEFTFSSPLSLNLLEPCHSLASANTGSTHTARFLSALRYASVWRYALTLSRYSSSKPRLNHRPFGPFVHLLFRGHSLQAEALAAYLT